MVSDWRGVSGGSTVAGVHLDDDSAGSGSYCGPQGLHGFPLSASSSQASAATGGVSVRAVWLRTLALYTLTRICLVEYTKRVKSVFEIISEPNRRAILSLLVTSQQSVGEIERELGIPQPTVSKHLRVLREAGFVESTVDAQRRLYRLKPEPFEEVVAWLAPFRRLWSVHVDALERHLDKMDGAKAKKKR